MSRQSISLMTLAVVASGIVAQSRFITPTGAQAGADANALGVTRVAGVANDKIPTDVLGTATVEAGAAIAAGATVKSDASGRAITWASAGARLGVALEPAAGAGSFIEVMLIPNAA